MKNIEKLNEMLKKEEELVKFHKKKVADLKKQIEISKKGEIGDLVNELNLTDSEYYHFKRLLKNKKSFLESLDVVKQNNVSSEESAGTDGSSVIFNSSDDVEDNNEDNTEI